MKETKAGDNWCLIPNFIWTNEKLNLQEKCLMGRILALAVSTGSCFSNNTFLSGELGITARQLQRMLFKLEDMQLIKRTVTYKSGKKQVDKRYITPTTLMSPPHDINVTTPHDINVVDRIELLEESVEENNNISIADTSAEPNINLLISLFEQVNPSYKTLYANKTQRGALQRLVKEHGEEKISKIISGLINIVTQPYAPKITTPLQLEQKLGELKIFMSQQVGAKKRGGVFDARS